MQEYVTLTIGKQKNIALIAHDNMKHELIAWVKENADILKRHFLFFNLYINKIMIYTNNNKR